MKFLVKQLKDYERAGIYPFHMPGHKRNTGLMDMGNPYGIDITEIDGFDNLLKPEGVLKAAMDRCGTLYGAKKSFFLVNGSTCGLLAAIAALTHRGDKILMARNCHKSVYHAVLVNCLEPLYLYPAFLEEFDMHGGISPEETERLLELHPDVKLAVVTSPTYEGVVSNISAIAAAVHRRGIPLLVDEAHGAHFGFGCGFPESALKMGADVVIQSIHKTLPGFTQTGVLHVNTSRVDLEDIGRYLAIYQTSSPSYVLMAGIDQCMELLEKKGDQLFARWSQMLHNFYQKMEGLSALQVRKPLGESSGSNTEMTKLYDIDKSKIFISTKNTTMTGSCLYGILLKEYGLQMEMASLTSVLAMTGLGDRQEGFDRLAHALLAADQAVGREKAAGESAYRKKGRSIEIESALKPDMVLRPWEAWEKPVKKLSLKESEGYLSADTISLYPPGIPLLAPGERIGADLIDGILDAEKNGRKVIGLDQGHIRVVFF